MVPGITMDLSPTRPFFDIDPFIIGVLMLNVETSLDPIVVVDVIIFPGGTFRLFDEQILGYHNSLAETVEFGGTDSKIWKGNTVSHIFTRWKSEPLQCVRTEREGRKEYKNLQGPFLICIPGVGKLIDHKRINGTHGKVQGAAQGLHDFAIILFVLRFESFDFFPGGIKVYSQRNADGAASE